MGKKSFKAILDNLNISEQFTTKPRQLKEKNKFINSIVPEKNWNFQADLLHLPTTKYNYKYLLVVTDLATNNFDFEPMISTKSAETVEAFKKIAKRKYLNLPKISLKTYGGSEFKVAPERRGLVCAPGF